MYDWLQVPTVSKTLSKKKGIQNSNSIDSSVEEIKCDVEADIEFIENQRNLGFYDFDDVFIPERRSLFAEFDEYLSEASESEWKYDKASSKKIYEFIKDSLRNTTPMKEHLAFRIKNVWLLPVHKRWQLYKFWLENFIEDKRLEYENLQHELKLALKDLSIARDEEDLRVIERAHVIGMTTTGAAKYRHIIEARNPIVLIVEEAAEILESHIITSLAPKTQHVILIGDQQQLRPSPNVYMLAIKYGMNISLFERMINNGMDYCKLLIQHRMRPEIAALIVPHIYTHLENHKSVTTFENIKGVNKNVFFINHNFDESLVQDSKSKTNVHEARFIIKLCEYLLLQGYKSSQITVLTTYLGQFFTLKKLANGVIRDVYFTVVDNFQGEENDIILISFVRSNNEGEVGFLKISNRICVALSRAKKGLYCIGNFNLFARKSKLWKNILQTLYDYEAIGTSLCLSCQNHPDVFIEVRNDDDFSAVPDGGCIRKCEYRLQCGHSCTLCCHPYDRSHEEIQCQKPCAKTCKEGHLCPKQCSDDCGSCEILVDKLLSRCGHTVTAPCGETESKIKCHNPCDKSCLKGHPCSKNCFQVCGACETLVDKELRCGHTVRVPCGKLRAYIKCDEPCNNACKNGHPCPKKCFDRCGNCKKLVEKTFTKCGHTTKTLCYMFDDIMCESNCIKKCDRGHTCAQKCFEICHPCKVIIERSLDSCGHTIKAECGKREDQIKCTLPCKKILPCFHQCRNKCFESCEKMCLELIEIQSPVCGHSFKVECCFANNLDVLSKRCPDPCNKTLPCNHICKGTCSGCKEGCDHTKCKETCKKMLDCGHDCTSKCSEPCVVKCKQITQVQSPVCGHFVDIECHFKNYETTLSQNCTEPCGEILPCDHQCKGTCGSCYQGRLHIVCKESCEKTLICGHKCESKCFKSCPPCEKPCENRCSHGKCLRICSVPCFKCTKPCDWRCKHKKCNRRCHELCDRDPCNEPCLKKMPCSHPCIGFCGEPCPKKCFMCDNIKFRDEFMNSKNNNNRYVYLEDCKHVFEEQELRNWITETSEGLEIIRMKTCPKCKTVIRKNNRFGYLIKHCLTNIEKVKAFRRNDRRKSLKLQHSVLNEVYKLTPDIKLLYKPVINILSSQLVRSIDELINIANVISISNEIESKISSINSLVVSSSFLQTLVNYTCFCREWLTNFIRENFLTVSEFQLLQLLREVHRLSLIDFLLSYASEKHSTSVSPEFESWAATVMTHKPFSNESIKFFENVITKLNQSCTDRMDIPDYKCVFEIVSMSGYWYHCPKEHITCLSECDQRVCCKCDKIEGAHNATNRLMIADNDFGSTDGESSKFNRNDFSVRNRAAFRVNRFRKRFF